MNETKTKSLITRKAISYKPSTKTKLFEHIKIQTNNTCTRKCSYCYFGNIKGTYENNILSDKIVYKMIDELASINYNGRIGLFEINEPLTDPRIFNFVSYVSKKIPKAWNMLISNGDLLNEKNLEEFNIAKLDQLCISVYDKKTLDKLNLIKKNRPDLFEIVEVMNFINGSFIDNRGGNIDYKDAPHTKDYIHNSCERVHKLLYVRPNGNVVSCFSDFYEVNILGNVYQNTLQDIWFGKKFSEFRRELNTGNRRTSALCAKCNYPGKGGFFRKYKKV